EALYHVRLGLPPHFGALLRAALAEVVVLGGEAEILVLQLGELAFETGHRLLRQLDERAFGRGGGGGIRRPRLLCRLWLLRMVLHGFPSHQAIAVPLAARRCDRELAVPHEASCQNRKGKLIRAPMGGGPRCARRRTRRCPPAPSRVPDRGGFRDTSRDTSVPRPNPEVRPRTRGRGAGPPPGPRLRAGIGAATRCGRGRPPRRAGPTGSRATRPASSPDAHRHPRRRRGSPRDRGSDPLDRCAPEWGRWATDRRARGRGRASRGAARRRARATASRSPRRRWARSVGSRGSARRPAPRTTAP